MTGNLTHRGGIGRPETSQEQIEQILELFQSDAAPCSHYAPCTVSRFASTMNCIFRDGLFLHLYKLYKLQLLLGGERKSHMEFVDQTSSHRDGYYEYLSNVFY